jgi:F1F0 ATPase subunit 2
MASEGGKDVIEPVLNNFMIPFTAGIIIGIMNYYILWITVQKMASLKQPLLWNMISFFSRTGIVLTIFYLVMDGRWEKLVVCLVGFLMVRFIFIRLFQPKKELRELSRGEGDQRFANKS